MPNNLLENLNEEQLKAVTHGDGPLMIIAGAGTGKTTVVTQRIAWLIEQKRAKPDEVLALTFTEKAATEMEERVDQLLPIGYVDLWISTFHSFCERVLKVHALEIGIPHEYKLLDEVGSLLMVRRNFDKFDLDYYRPRGNPTRFIKALLTHFSRAKDELITPQMYIDYAEKLQLDLDSVEGAAGEGQDGEMAEAARIKELANAYHTYQQLLLDNNALDFADLVNYTLELFKTRANILEQYRQQFKFILVDEFQDTNKAQYELVKLLASPRDNLTVVGDDDQSIYKFRGASLENILKFREDYPDTSQIVLTKNYRSAAAILDGAYKVIQQNNPNRLEVKEKLDKKLTSEIDCNGAVCHIHAATLDDEVRRTIETIAELRQASNCHWSDFAILVRANSSADPFIRAFERAGIPYRFMAMSGLYTKPIILDVIAHLRVLAQPHESPSMYRILSHPQLGLVENDIAELSLFSRRKGKSLCTAMQGSSFIQDMSEDGKARTREILDLLILLRQESKRMPASELFVEVMKRTGLLADVRLRPEQEQQELFGYLQQFFERLKRFESDNDDTTLYHFLEEFDHERDAGEVGALAGDPEEGPDVVNVMTVHGSKGLEFKYVFLANLVEQRFPSTNRSDAISFPEKLISSAASKDHHIEEERRLFYVAMTRAKERLYLLSAEDYGGKRNRKPSRFLAELGIEPEGGITHNQIPVADAISITKTSKTPANAIEYTLPKAVSFTQLAAFSACPLQYKFAHILKVPVFGRHTLSFGKTMHNSLQKFMERIAATQQRPQASLFESEEPKGSQIPSENELLEIYKSSWIDEWYPNDQTRKEYFDNGKESLLAYRQDVINDTPTIHSLEKGFTLKIGDVAVRGRIDRVDQLEDGVEIIDYKTGSPMDEKPGWDKKKQLVLYKMAAEQCFDPPVKVKKLTYHFLTDNSRVSFEATEKDCEKLQNEILTTVDAIKHSEFGATPGFNCKYCDFKDICEFSTG
ncbi:MAG: ATP-dependent DNA helicase [bacterium]